MPCNGMRLTLDAGSCSDHIAKKEQRGIGDGVSSVAATARYAAPSFA